jgi:hypothetical protein
VQKGVLVYDPSIAGSAGAKLAPQGPPGTAGNGGGSISGAGTYYSRASYMKDMQEVAETVIVTGTLTGTLSLEVMNADEEADLAGVDEWCDFTPATAIPAITGTTTATVGRFGRSDTVRYSAYRMKFVWASGSGTLSVRRILKRR